MDHLVTPIQSHRMARIKLANLPVLAKRSKYGSKKVEYQGWTFDSQLECDFYKHLQLLKAAGKVDMFFRQFVILLAPGSKLVVDFMVKYTGDPAWHFIDTKGYMTPNAKTKIKLAEHLYGIKIKIVKRGDF